MTATPHIRPAVAADIDRLWPIIRAVVSAGDTYGLDPDMDRDTAAKLWLDQPDATYVIEENGRLLGTYYIKPNQAGPGRHVCNCGYMVAEDARGRGLATLMCDHSKRRACALGYLAMQFNFVATTNTGAIGLWKKLGFEVVGRLPRAFHHPKAGYVDALVMYQWLADDPENRNHL